MMAPNALPIADDLKRFFYSINTLFAETARPDDRADQLTERLHSLWPGLPFYACVWDQKTSIRDSDGRIRPEWDDMVRPELLAVLAGSDIEGLGHVLVSEPDDPPTRICTEVIADDNKKYGVLALAFPPSMPPDVQQICEVTLAECAGRLAALCSLERAEREAQALRQQVADLMRHAEVGELSGPLIHACNNFLNVVLLQMAVLGEELDEEIRSESQEIRRQGVQLATIVKQFQQYRNRPRPSARPIDLNGVIEAAIEAMSCEPDHGRSRPRIRPLLASVSTDVASVSVDTKLTRDLPNVVASPAELRHLVTFLLIDATRAALGGSGAIEIKTASATQGIQLTVTNSGPSLPPELLAELFELPSGPSEHPNSLELAACKSLVRRLQGKIRAENCEQGGVVVIVELPTYQEAS